MYLEAVLKYDPDQPRDELGRFGSGGAGSSGRGPAGQDLDPSPDPELEEFRRDIAALESGKAVVSSMGKVDRKEEEIKQLSTKIKDLNSRIPKGSRGPEDTPETIALRREREKLRDERKKLLRTAIEAEQATIQVVTDAREEAHRRIRDLTGGGSSIDLRISDRLPKNSRATAEVGRKFVEGVLAPGVLRHPVRVESSTTGRAFARGSSVHLPDYQYQGATMVHELGHVIETQSSAHLEAAASFWERRTKGELVRPLNALLGRTGFRDDEEGASDDFIDPYAGKIYFGFSTTSGKEGIRATEVTSMGLELLYRDPVKFARDDPDHFRFTVQQLRGYSGKGGDRRRGLHGAGSPVVRSRSRRHPVFGAPRAATRPGTLGSRRGLLPRRGRGGGAAGHGHYAGAQGRVGLWDSVLRYDPDQPRDEQGRFGSTGSAPAASPEYVSDLVSDLRARAQRVEREGRRPPSEVLALGYRALQDNEGLALALAERMEKSSGSRESMLRATASLGQWATNWDSGAADEWAAAQALGANKTLAKHTREVVAERPGLSGADLKAYEERTEFVQEYARANVFKGEEEVEVFRGVRGAYAKRIPGEPGAEHDLKVYGLTSWTTSARKAQDFAGRGGTVVATKVKLKDVWNVQEIINSTSIVRYSDDTGEVVVKSDASTRKVRVDWRSSK
jgi:hypothetical protein